MNGASEKYGDQFNETAATVGKDWETRIWHKLDVARSDEGFQLDMPAAYDPR